MSSNYSINSTKHLSEIELKSLLEDIKLAPPRDALMLELALTTGARSQEILNIRLKDLTFSRGIESVIIWGLKGSHDRDLPLTTELCSRLMKYVNQNKFRPEDRLFPLTTRMFRYIWRKYIPHKKLHSLRHTRALDVYSQTKDPRLVQAYLGHKSLTNTLVYVQYSYSLQELRKLVT